MASGIARARVRTTTTTTATTATVVGVAQNGGHAPAHRLTKTCSLRLYWKYAIFSKRDFQRKNSSISTNYSGGWFNIFNKGCTEAIREQEFTAKEVVKSEWASAEEEGETVLNNAVSCSESEVNERRWNNSEQRHEAKLTRVINYRKEAKYPTNYSEDHRLSRV